MTYQGDIEDGSDDDKLLVAEYALGLLDAGEHARLSLRLRDESALRFELTMWRSRLSSLDSEFGEVAPPTRVLSRIEDRLFGVAAVSSPVAQFWNSLALWRGVTAGALAVAVVAIGVNLLQPRVDTRAFANQLVAAMQAENSNVSFVALYDPANGSVRLTALSGEAVPNRDYELWAIEGASAPVSMGIVPVDARSVVTMPRAVAEGFGAGTVLAVSLEPKGGAPEGKPTGPIVAKGAATPI